MINSILHTLITKPTEAKNYNKIHFSYIKPPALRINTRGLKMKKHFYLIAVALFAVLAISCQTNGGDPRAIVLYSADFATTTDWSTDSTANVTRSIENGTYSLSAIADNIGAWTYIPYGYGSYSGSILPAYELEVNATLVRSDGSGDGSVLIIFNYIDSENYDCLDISQYGSFRLMQRVNNVATVILDWGTTASFRTEDLENNIRLVQYNDKLEIYGNDSLITATTLIKGKNFACRIGLGVRSYTDATITSPKAMYTSVKLTALQ